MGKLSIRVHSCVIHRPCTRVDISPRVVVVVDNTYRFRTGTHQHTFEPTFGETFVVGNTHRLAVIEVSVYDIVESKNKLLQGLTGAGGGGGGGGGTGGSLHQHHGRSLSQEGRGGFFDSVFKGRKEADAAAWNSLQATSLDNDADDGGEANLLGRCYLSIERFVHGQPKTRTYLLGTPLQQQGSMPTALAMPPGVAGSIIITLSSEGLGESPSVLRINDALERRYVERLKRFLLRTDKAKLQVVDLIIANVRDTVEKLEGTSRFAAVDSRLGKPSAGDDEEEEGGEARRAASAHRLKTALTVTAGGVVVSGTAVTVSKRTPQLTFNRPPTHETFAELMARLCTEYGCFESSTFRVKIRVDGCTNLDKKALNTAMIGSDEVFAVLRTECDDFATSPVKLQNTVVWTERNEVVFDVVNPDTFVVHVVVMGRSSQRCYEIGRTSVGVAPLALECASERHLYLCSFDNVTLPQITGAVHLSLKPLNFGLVSAEFAKQIDDFYDRLSKFFQRYDVVRVPQVDTLVRARIGELDEFMQDLIVEHGREPGSVRLLVTVDRIVALHEDMGSELSDKEVHVVITMGGTAVRTKSRKVSRFVATKFNEGYCFDVVRETDLIRLEVVKASDESVVYGCVDFTCLNIQRGVTNTRMLYLVGNAGTAAAYISGIIHFSMFSGEVGKDFAIDEEQERFFYGRLRRYAYRRMPENLHRVSLAVDMVFDMESFMAQIASLYGEEDPTLAIHFTVIGCRQLRAKFGGVDPYVVVRVGVDSYQTKTVKDNPEADFFEFCTFFIDRTSDHYITLIVMDQADVGEDSEIGRVVISLRDVTIGQQYHDFRPLQPPPLKKKRSPQSKDLSLPFGSIGVRRKSGPDGDNGKNGGTGKENSDDRLLSTEDYSLSFGDGPRGSSAEHGDESTPAAKQKLLGSVGFKYTVADMHISDATRYRLIRQQAQRDGIYVSPHLRTYGADDAARAVDIARDSVGGRWQPLDGGALGDGLSHHPSMVTDGGAPVSPSRQQKGFLSQYSNPFNGWMGKLKGFQRSIEVRARHTVAASGGEGGRGGPSLNTEAGSATQIPLTAGEGMDDASSVQSAAGVPTVNLMDEGIMDLDAFLSAPVLSHVNSAADEDDEENDFDTGGGASSTRYHGLPGVVAVAGGGARSPSLPGSSRGSSDSLARPIRDAGRALMGAPQQSSEIQAAHAAALSDGEDDLDKLFVHANTISVFLEGGASDAEVHPDAPAARKAFSDHGPKYLRIRIVYCKRLFCATKQKPNPYLLFSTINETHRTRIEFDTVNPRYNEEFNVVVDDPLKDYLHISVLTDTPYGSKQLGHCVLSLRNVQRGQWHTRWASFVVNSHRPNAFEQGSVCVSLMGDGFGLEYLPSTDAENRLRERLRDFLVSKNPSQLHRLEWFVGEYSDQQSNVLTRLFGKYYIASDAMQSADVTVCVKAIRQLCIDGGLLFSGNCVVKVKANGKTCAKTRSVPGTDGLFTFEETLRFKLDNPGTTPLRLSVVANGREKAGETFLSLQDLHKGVEQERTHVLAVNARGTHPTPSGFLTCSVMSPTFGSTSAPPTADENERFYRLQRFLFYYRPEEVSMADLRYSATLNANAYLQKLVRLYGPEPGDFNLRLVLQRCVNMHFTSGRAIHPFAVIRCGMAEHRTSIVEGQLEAVFYETFDLKVGVPDLERVEILFFDFTPAKCHEIGRTQISLKTLIRGHNNDLRLPLVRDPGTRFAEVNGLVELQAYTSDFGMTHVRSQSSAFFAPEESNPNNEYLGPNSADSLSGAPGGDGKKGRSGSHTEGGGVSGALSSIFGRRTKSFHTLHEAPHHSVPAPQPPPPPPPPPSTGGGGGVVGRNPRDPNHVNVMVSVAITRFIGFKVQDVELYIRVTSRNEVLVRTKPIAMSELASLKEHVAFKVDEEALFTDRVFTLKLGLNSFLSNEAVCYADFCLAQCAPGTVTEKRLRLYEHKTSDFLGICHLQVDVPAGASDYHQGFRCEASVAESILDDMASLVAKYSPKDLRKLDLSFFHSADVRRLHRSLRPQLCPSVVATVYVAIHEVKLSLTTAPTSFLFKHMCTVSAICGDYSAEVIKRTAITTSNASSTILPYGMSRTGVSSLDFCPLRVDITPTGPDALLTLCVNDRQNSSKVSEVGRTVVSLRALLSPQVYDMGEQVTVPLVEQRRVANRAQASLLGTITFSLYSPAYETYPRSLRFPSSDLKNFNREYVRYYADRTYRLLKNYDANSLVDLHAKVYERFVPGHAWKRGLPEYLAGLVEMWGPELEPAGPVPPL